MKTLDTMKAVYCYFFPETREVLREVNEKLPDEMFLVSTPAEKVDGLLEDLVSGFKCPRTASGNIDLDEIHQPIIKRILQAYQPHLPALEDFGHVYPTSGSSEGLFHILTKLKVEGVKEAIIHVEPEGNELECKEK